jgi:hypothetical protein
MRIQKDIVTSTVLAIAIVGGGLWLLDRSTSISTPVLQNVPDQPRNITDRNISTSRTDRQPEDNASDTAAIPPPVAHGIRKCTVGGKTTYSNSECPEGTQTKAVVLHDSGGIVSPPKADLLMLMAQRKAAEGQHGGRQSVVTMGTPQSATEECGLLDQHVQYLDSKARQPQSATTQDWIRQERSKARDRQVALHC